MKNVLIVEDQDSQFEHMERKLSKTAQDSGQIELLISRVITGAEARASVVASHFDLVSIDGTFPQQSNDVMDGSAGLSMVRFLVGQKFRGKILLYSGNSDDIEHVRGVSGLPRQVHARTKSLIDVKNEDLATVNTWANLCIQLLREK